MKTILIAAATLGLLASSALADCKFHQKSAQADTSDKTQSQTATQ